MYKLIACCAILIGFCTKNAFSQQSIDSYVLDSNLNVFTLVASSTNSLVSPVDLDFFPNQATRPFQLWILNQGTSTTGGSTVIVSNANKSTRTSKYVKDGNAWHFMDMASAIAFGDSLWATSADVLDANHNTGRYTGPTLWPSDLSIYGIVGNPSSPTVNGSHLDMIHQSPYSKGIAFERDLVYWVLDGYEGNLKRYDFGQPHQPGGSNHSAGLVRVYTDFQFTKHVSLPSHMVIDENKKYLYGCDPVGKRIFRVDITTGTDNGPGAKVNVETLVEYENYIGLDIKDVITTNLTSPVGIDIYGNRLIVTDNGTDEIIIYDISKNFKEVGRIKLKYTSNPDPMGIKVGPDGKIYFADKANKRVYMIDNTSVWALSINGIKKDLYSVSAYPNPSKPGLIIINGMENISSYSIYDLCGSEIRFNRNAKENEINTDGLSQGMYILRLNNPKETQTIKIQIQ